jgi:hypothetical protein
MQTQVHICVITCCFAACAWCRNHYTTNDGKPITMEAVNSNLPAGWVWEDEWCVRVAAVCACT